jgi:hypothetical protein
VQPDRDWAEDDQEQIDGDEPQRAHDHQGRLAKPVHAEGDRDNRRDRHPHEEQGK